MLAGAAEYADSNRRVGVPQPVPHMTLNCYHLWQKLETHLISLVLA